MERRPFGPTGSDVPVIGQGTWNIDTGDRASAIAALRRGLELGMTHIDTAELYGNAEEVVAEAIVGRRDQVFLVSKVLPENASRSGTIAACERSLTRLRTDRLDCYLLHWRGEQPLGDTFAAFEQLRREGKILSWGVSNFDEPDLGEALEIAGEGRLACNQVLYHLEERAIEHAVIPWCEAHGVAVVAYSPLGHGHFPGPRSKGGRVLQEIVAALDRQPVGARLFHEQDWGGMIEAECRPARPAFVDDRFELFGKDAILKYVDALTGGPDWDALRDRERIELVWVRPDRGLARRLDSDPSWQVVYRDDVSVLFHRKSRPATTLTQAD